jgi:hypothetical protein
MDAKRLIEQLLEHSGKLHPNYSQDQHLAWCMGFLASIAVEKNHMDNVIWTRIKNRINQLYSDSDN